MRDFSHQHRRGAIRAAGVVVHLRGEGKGKKLGGRVCVRGVGWRCARWLGISEDPLGVISRPWLVDFKTNETCYHHGFGGREKSVEGLDARTLCGRPP